MKLSYILANLMIGPLLLALSLIFRAFPPKKINYLYGYRTARSMKSQEAWEASNKYSLELFMWIGIILTILQILLSFFFPLDTVIFTTCIVMTVLLFASVYKVETFLKKHFDEDGKPRKTK